MLKLTFATVPQRITSFELPSFFHSGFESCSRHKLRDRRATGPVVLGSWDTIYGERVPSTRSIRADGHVIPGIERFALTRLECWSPVETPRE